jgi:imidazolonepropionase-like amidohydrolase
MADAGVHLITGTDAPTIPGVIPGFSLHRDLHVLEQAGLTRYQVLSAATRVPGEFIRKAIPKSESVGTIAPGNRADLILSTGNPLDDLSTIEKPLGVMAHGVWYTASDLQSLLEEVAKKYEMR